LRRNSVQAHFGNTGFLDDGVDADRADTFTIEKVGGGFQNPARTNLHRIGMWIVRVALRGSDGAADQGARRRLECFEVTEAVMRRI
jgi:hypothetical protein